MSTNPNITLFYGENQHSLKTEANLWKQAFFQKYPDTTNFTEFKNPEKEFLDVLNEVLTPPFLGSKRLIYIYNLQGTLDLKQYKKFINTLENLPDTSILLFIEETKLAKNAKLLKDITKLGKSKEFTLSIPDLISTSNNLLKKLNKQIHPELLKDLILKLEKDPFKIENELTKLALFSDTPEITPDQINLLVKFPLSTTIFALLDLISYQKTQQALASFSELIESGEEPTKIFYLLIRQVRILTQLLSLKQQNKSAPEIAKLTNLHPFIVNKTLPSLKGLNLSNLQSTLNTLLSIDTQIKTGLIKYSKTDSTELLLALETTLLRI